MSFPSSRELAAMAEISRALACEHWDRAFVLLCEQSTPAIAAAFLVDHGVPAEELPRDAKRAIVNWKRDRELAS